MKIHLILPPDPSSELDLCRGILGGCGEGWRKKEKNNISNNI